ncbi:MAG: hypothetical protein HY821_13300 [Acidobacteria bacterium]|nr:hypothetical protein [Acidobacteriota bacterium]
MATSTNPDVTLADAAAARGLGAMGAPKGLARWLWPSLFDIILVSLPLWFFGLADGGTGLLLSDGDTGWHIRTGEWILSNHSFVWHDLFSFSKPGGEWFAWEWLSDVLLALAHQAAGLRGVALGGIVLSALFCGILFRHMVWRGANIFIALPLSLMGFGAATVHLLARPHLFTMVAVAATAWMIQADLRRPGRWIWLLVPVTTLWTNLHGGWLALIAMLGLTAVGTAMEVLLGAAQWRTVKRYLLLAAACFAASFVNPYGWKLHLHTAKYLTSSWIKDVVSEFQSPVFRSENMAQYEILLLCGCAAVGLAMLRKEFAAPLVVLFWAHSSLQSARHIPIFVAVGAPLVAEQLQWLWKRWTEGAKKNSVAAILDGLSLEAAPGLKRVSLWPWVTLVLVAMQVIPMPWRSDFPSTRFPVEMVNRHKDLLAGSRILTEDQWGDYLIYRFYPKTKVFFDGRTDYYGEDLTKEYQRLLSAEHGYRQLLDKYRFDVVLARPNWALAAVLKESKEWRVVADDKKAILLARVQPLASVGKSN